MAGRLSQYSPEIQERFKSVTTIEEVNQMANDFKDAVAAGDEKKLGWVSAAYGTSKALLIAATNVFAKDEKNKGSSVLINSCCPGCVFTVDRFLPLFSSSLSLC